MSPATAQNKLPITVLFPGQGSQFVGMGKNCQDTSLFDEASKLLDIPLKNICFEGPEETLKLTEYTQPALLTHSLSLWRELQKNIHNQNIEVTRVLGHSVGEYAALVAAGAISFQDAVKAVRLRGKYMQEAVPMGLGTMVAILKCSEELVRKACTEASTADSKVSPANFNDPGQIVISGHVDACERAVEWLTANSPDRIRAITLNVSAPFHSPLMKPAAEKLSQVLGQITFHPPQIPYIANVNATEYSKSSASQVRELLVEQVCGSVLWTQSIQKLPASTVFVEVGPGKVLSGLVKKIHSGAQVFNVDSPMALSSVIESLSALRGTV